MSTVNFDHIDVIKENDGRVCFESIIIPKDVELLSELKAMVENPNRTVLDMQNRMSLHFNRNNRMGYSYIHPYSYSSSYVGGAIYPVEMTSAEYNEKIAKIKDELNEKKYALDVYEKMLCDSITDIKINYLAKASRYVDAYSYYNQVAAFRNDPSVKMYSTETIGWSSFTFDISEDVKINVKSNFGFGWSSYFFVNLTYKGIDILPYSYWVKYYCADKESVMRYTRNYATSRSSWEIAFRFVEDVANKAKNDESGFLSEFVLNEVGELMRGLRIIMNTPMAYLTQCYAERSHRPEANIVGIYHGSDDFGAPYEVYRSELAMAVMAEKVTGSIGFLDNLKKFADILPQVKDSVDEIKRMAVGIVPQLVQGIAKLKNEIDVRTRLLNDKEAEYESLQSELKPHAEIIDRMYEEAKNAELNKPQESRVTVWRSTCESEYRSQHEDYDKLCNRDSEMASEISKMRSDINKRDAFRRRLDKCVEVVNGSNL